MAYQRNPEEFSRHNPWRYWVERFNGTSKVALLVSLVTLAFVFSADQQRIAACHTANSAAAELSIRGTILARFLDDAASVREKATVDIKLNRGAAKRWHTWADQINSVKTEACKHFGIIPG